MRTRNVRITPACAGKRLHSTWRYPQKKDHPRVCGEKKFGDIADNKAQGSPPRVRGKASSSALLLRLGGITPACAGKSSLVLLHKCIF